MTRRLRRLVAVCALLAWWPAEHTHAESRRSPSDLAQVSQLIDALQLDEAERLLAEIDAKSPGNANVVWNRALLDFYRGEYGSAVELSKVALETGGGKASKNWMMFGDLFRSTEALTRDYRKVTSDDGRYVVSFADGKERVLAPYALDVLAAADRALTKILGTPVPGPVRLEIYPSEDSLAEVSSLTVEQIETSGTVALCKWNRLMITSPRALVRGYPWADTVAHELTHLYLSYLTKEKAPVWLQEGSAKLLERRWRPDETTFELEPTSRELLATATKGGKLLTFEQMHPSIAMLPSQDDAALAFAQVSTFMAEFVKVHGEPALRSAYGLVAEGTDARDALAKAAGKSFSELERAWKTTLPRTKEASAPRKLARRFRASQGDKPDESDDVASEAAKKFLRLGDLLWDARRTRAAMIEYDKAFRANTDDPIVASRLSRAALEAGDAARSLAAVDGLVKRYPDHAPTHAVRGAALAALGRNDEARLALIEAIRINPFDSDPHCVLGKISTDDREARIEREACKLLSGQ
jgi:tetratricopeptide (TPR) repeat protein